MKKLAFALALIATPTLAQDAQAPTAINYLKNTIANCTAESASLFEQANKYAIEARDLKAQVEALQKQLEAKKETK